MVLSLTWILLLFNFTSLGALKINTRSFAALVCQGMQLLLALECICLNYVLALATHM